ncbi:MAG: hypothetical protein AAF734_06985 [Bacteroidota bacterium]
MGVLIPIIALLIPLSAIVGGYVLSYQKMKLKKTALNREDKQKIEQVLRENKVLKGRIENLEAIITGIDQELLSLKAFDDTLKNQQNIQQLANKLKKED